MDYNFRKKPVTALVPTMEYLGLVPTKKQSTGDGEIHLTLRANPQQSWATDTRALSLEQAVRLKADLEMAITALRDNGVTIPDPIPPYQPA